MRVAWFSPLSLRNRAGGLIRSSYYSRLVAPLLAKYERWEVEFFTDDSDYDQCRAENRTLVASENRVPKCDSVPVFHHLSAFLRHRTQPFDVFIYQLEDHPAAAFVRKVLRVYPGVVVFHDLVFARMNYQGFADQLRDDSSSLDEETESEESSGFERKPAIDSISKRDEWKMRGWSTEFQSEERAFKSSSFEQAGVIGVRNVHAAHEVRRNVSGAQVELCRFATPLVDESQRAIERNTFRARQEAPILSDHFLIGFDSRNLIEERGRLIFESLAPWLERDLTRSLLWVLPSESARESAQRFMSRLPVELSMRCTLSFPGDWSEYGEAVSACDAWVSPRFDILREAPVGSALAAARGIPVVCTDFGPSGELPRSTIFLTPPGSTERVHIAECAELLRNDPALRKALGISLRAMAEELFDPGNAAHDLVSSVRRSRQQLQERLQEEICKYDRAATRVESILSDFETPERVFSGTARDPWNLPGK